MQVNSFQLLFEDVNSYLYKSYKCSARGAAESVETLDKLRQTRDTLNDILTENDQLKIEVR